MTTKKKQEKAAWRTGDVQDFLQLTDAEMALIDLKIALSNGVRDRRVKAGLTQGQLAKLIGSSQPRIARLEGPASDATIDFTLRALFALGVTHKTVGQLIGGITRKRKAA